MYVTLYSETSTVELRPSTNSDQIPNFDLSSILNQFENQIAIDYADHNRVHSLYFLTIIFYKSELIYKSQYK